MSLLLALAATLLSLATTNASGAGARGAGCRVPRLKGLKLAEARERARHAGCMLRVQGAKLERARVQTVERQSPAGGKHAATVTVWINPLCHGSADYGPEITEPLLTPGPTELIAGFYLDGGPLALFSTPGCRRPEPPSGGGTVEVIDAATGALLATQTAAYAHLAEIPLAPGTYKVIGTFAGATIDGQHATETMTVQVPAGHTVRQDFVLSIP